MVGFANSADAREVDCDGRSVKRVKLAHLEKVLAVAESYGDG